jgi:hypothetical protein
MTPITATIQGIELQGQVAANLAVSSSMIAVIYALLSPTQKALVDAGKLGVFQAIGTLAGHKDETEELSFADRVSTQFVINQKLKKALAKIFIAVFPGISTEIVAIDSDVIFEIEFEETMQIIAKILQAIEVAVPVEGVAIASSVLPPLEDQYFGGLKGAIV